jgi:hypothetical protein
MNARRPLLLRAGLAINAVAAFAAAAVLFVAPGAIPATVGIELDRPQFFVAYLLAAAELGLSVMAALALKASRDAVRLAVVSLVLMHVASAVAGVLAVEQGASLLIFWNVLARVAVVALLMAGWLALPREPYACRKATTRES